MSPARCSADRTDLRGDARSDRERNRRAVDLIFAPPEQIRDLSDLVDEAAESDTEIADPPEPIINGVIDLGRIATDACSWRWIPIHAEPDAVFSRSWKPPIPRIIRLLRSKRCGPGRVALPRSIPASPGVAKVVEG